MPTVPLPFPWGGVSLSAPHLQDDNEEEIDVGHAVELLVQVQRQEGQDVVLGRVDEVGLPGRRH